MTQITTHLENPACTSLLMNYDHYTNKAYSYRRQTALQGALILAKSGRLELE